MIQTTLRGNLGKLHRKLFGWLSWVIDYPEDPHWEKRYRLNLMLIKHKKHLSELYPPPPLKKNIIMTNTHKKKGPKNTVSYQHWSDWARRNRPGLSAWSLGFVMIPNVTGLDDSDVCTWGSMRSVTWVQSLTLDKKCRPPNSIWL